MDCESIGNGGGGGNGSGMVVVGMDSESMVDCGVADGYGIAGLLMGGGLRDCVIADCVIVDGWELEDCGIADGWGQLRWTPLCWVLPVLRPNML